MVSSNSSAFMMGMTGGAASSSASGAGAWKSLRATELVTDGDAERNRLAGTSVGERAADHCTAYRGDSVLVLLVPVVLGDSGLMRLEDGVWKRLDRPGVGDLSSSSSSSSSVALLFGVTVVVKVGTRLLGPGVAGEVESVDTISSVPASMLDLGMLDSGVVSSVRSTTSAVVARRTETVILRSSRDRWLGKSLARLGLPDRRNRSLLTSGVSGARMV